MKIGLCAVALCVAAVASVGCNDTVQATTACSNVENNTRSVARAEFLPCATELLASIDALGPLTQATMKGSKQARLDGEAALRQLIPIIDQAGGDRLLERSTDVQLSDLRAEIYNTVTKYRAFFALTIPPDYHPQAGKARYFAQRELDGALRHFEEARGLYKRLQGS